MATKRPAKRSDAKLRLDKELADLKHALDESAIVAITDQRGIINYVNDKFCDVSKYAREELIGQDHRIINSGYHSKEFIRSIWTTIASGNIWRGDLRNRAKDGSLYWVDTTIVPFLNDDGKPFQYVAIRHEITERKLAEERIRQQASLLDSVRDAILVCDLDFRTIYWNKSAEREYGWTSAEALGRSVGELLCPGDDDQIDHARSGLDNADEWEAEFRHQRRNGEQIIVESRWTRVRSEAGDPAYYLVINTDITDKKRTQEQLFRAQRMESIGTLAGGIAHDLNNILSPIMMSVDMLRLGEPDAESLRWMDMIKENAERGTQLVKQVLTFARGMAGERHNVHLKHITKDLIEILNQTLPKSITVKYHISSDLWPILADPTQVHQVLMNIAINARDAMPSGGTLTIKVENVYIDESYARMNIDARPGNYDLVSITDTGYGMGREVMERIFDPFFTTKEVGKGTGLGLATAMTIVRSHGGFINVYSERSKGTRFSIYFPAAEQAVQSSEVANTRDLPRGNGELILVVDDESNIREITEATLVRFGYQVVTAVDGTNALAVYSQHGPEIAGVLTDLAMPYMDGTSLIRALRKMKPAIKIIAMSGLMSGGQMAELTELNVDAVLSKPFSAETLLTTLAPVVSGSTAS